METKSRSVEQEEHAVMRATIEQLEITVEQTRAFNEASRNINTKEHDSIKAELKDIQEFVDILMSFFTSWQGFTNIIVWLRNLALYGGVAYFVFMHFYGSGFGG